MNFNIQTLTGEGVKSAQVMPETQAWAPEKWDQSGVFVPVKDIPRVPIICGFIDPCPEPDAIIATEHWHDGTLTFTLLAITVIVTNAEEYIRKEGGSWVSSKVYIKSEDVGGRHPYHESVSILLKRLPESETEVQK